MKKKLSKIRVLPFKIGVYLGLATLVLANLGLAQRAFAATLMTHAELIEYSMNSSANSQITLAFTAGASDSAGSLVIAMGAGVSAVAASQTATTAGCTTLTGASTALPGTLASSTGSGTTITINNVNALTSGTSYCVNLTSATAVTNSASTGNYTATFTDGSDTTTIGYDVIANDQIVVSATVPPSFTLGFSGNTDAFTANLSSALFKTTTGITLTISTNATNGWGLWAMDTNAGLHSTVASKTIASVSTSANSNFTTDEGSEDYGLGVATDGTTNWADAGGNTGGGLSSSTYNEIASNGTTASGLTTVVKELADISGTTPAASDYSDTVTIVGAGSF
jgi:hypothetical protein